MLRGVVKRAELTQCLERNDFSCHQKVTDGKLKVQLKLMQADCSTPVTRRREMHGSPKLIVKYSEHWGIPQTVEVSFQHWLFGRCSQQGTMALYYKHSYLSTNGWICCRRTHIQMS